MSHPSLEQKEPCVSAHAVMFVLVHCYAFAGLHFFLDDSNNWLPLILGCLGSVVTALSLLLKRSAQVNITLGLLLGFLAFLVFFGVVLPFSR